MRPFLQLGRRPDGASRNSLRRPEVRSDELPVTSANVPCSLLPLSNLTLTVFHNETILTQSLCFSLRMGYVVRYGKIRFCKTNRRS
jgi:hypothetical protein